MSDDARTKLKDCGWLCAGCGAPPPFICDCVTDVAYRVFNGVMESARKVAPGAAVRRLETASEHIARDMREGRFPAQSERQMVPVTSRADLAITREDHDAALAAVLRDAVFQLDSSAAGDWRAGDVDCVRAAILALRPADALERALARAREEERERCAGLAERDARSLLSEAKLADEAGHDMAADTDRAAAHAIRGIAAAIRADDAGAG